MQNEFFLYHTSACHLCELAEALIRPVFQSADFSARNLQLRLIDIADDDTLLENYGIRIPVVFNPHSRSDIGWPFTAQDIVRFIESTTEGAAND